MFFFRERYSLLLTFILTLTFSIANAHQDFFTVAHYGNVTVRVRTGFDYEEINKGLIIGKLAEKLSRDLAYAEPIFLDFNHNYIGGFGQRYFVCYDKGKIENTCVYGSNDQDYLDRNALMVRQLSSSFNVVSTLQLVEYS